GIFFNGVLPSDLESLKLPIESCGWCWVSRLLSAASADARVHKKLNHLRCRVAYPATQSSSRPDPKTTHFSPPERPFTFYKHDLVGVPFRNLPSHKVLITWAPSFP
uniref:Uncharacterized protein n=1 Tax=Glossina palpalis gambiensis TaxID=67801 RepID=A0A1B0BZH0_9MUSC